MAGGVGDDVGVGVADAVGTSTGVAVGTDVGVSVGVGVGAGMSLQALRTTAMARTVRTASQRIRKEDTVISVVYPHVVLELRRVRAFSYGRVSISERAVSGSCGL